jgi:valyl-tRNA synthetase
MNPMKAIELEKAFNPKAFEDRIYAQWKTSGAFKPIAAEQDPYVIVIPPPNVTGILHLGHGLNISLQDIIIRFHRMRGEPTLWVPGTDHAGIATQNVVEKRLLAKGQSRQDLGRERFVEETWKVKEEHHAVITRQLERIGASVDWDRERFTFDEGLSKAVREVFVTLYERDLLYKGEYLVNWCSSCGTALADDEVEHEEQDGTMYHLRYPCSGGGFIELATTRPETMLGDTAVAVHPEDERYRELIGQTALLPLCGRAIPIVADAYVDRAFGTGVVKITPAHDPNDWEVAKRHKLPLINILTPDGRLNNAVPEPYRNLTVKEAREAVLAGLKDGGFYIKEEKIKHAVGHCYRCETVIEPFLSKQWFVRMKPLAEKALASWRSGELIFYPRKWENTYQHWLENIRDWCISRQLWWGHRIPAWYCADCGKTIVSRNDISVCPHCSSTAVVQDPDVLDTWFSSWLWPFSTLGWPEKTADTAAFYPNTALITGYDILFFWVSRMIMAGLEFTGKAPFRDIFLTGLICDKQGRKMSKSLGNGLDPLDLVDEFGADALRFTLAFMCAQGQDILIDKDAFKLGSKFANKVWNASRYILMNLEGRRPGDINILSPADRWIYARLNSAAKAISAAFLSYRYNAAAAAAYEFFWNDFCDWYIEATKLSMRTGDDDEKDRASAVLLDILTQSLRLLHPFLPFVTEAIYEKLPNHAGLLISAPYPAYDEARADSAAEENFDFLRELVRMIRTLKSECAIPVDKKIPVLVCFNAGDTRAAFLGEQAELSKLLAGIAELRIKEESVERRDHTQAGAITLLGSGFEAFVFVAEALDLALLKRKFCKELDRDKKFIMGLEAKLNNDSFIKNAPPELVAAEKAKLDAALQRTAKLEAYIRSMA